MLNYHSIKSLINGFTLLLSQQLFRPFFCFLLAQQMCSLSMLFLSIVMIFIYFVSIFILYSCGCRIHSTLVSNKCTKVSRWHESRQLSANKSSILHFNYFQLFVSLIHEISVLRSGILRKFTEGKPAVIAA